jgi:hypothetical protein
MADRFILSHLKRLPLLAPLSPEQLEALANNVQVLRYEPGEIVFAQGKPVAGLFIMISGRGLLVQTGPDHVERPVGEVAAGEYLNESALFEEALAPATLRIIETSIFLLISRQKFVSLMSVRPDIRNVLRPPNVPTAPSAGIAAIEPNVSPKVFPGQRDTEKVILQTRRHWWAFVRRIWFIGVILLVLLVVIALLRDATLLAFSIPLMLLGVGASAYIYLEWRNDLFVITDQRIVNFRREIFAFTNNVSEIPLEAVQEVNVVVPPTDPMARLFNYGTLVIKTSGDITNLRITFLANPKMVQNEIFKEQKGVRNRVADQARLQTRNAIRNDLDRFLGNAPPPTETVGEAVAVQPVQPGFLSTRYTDENGNTVYRKHIIVWFRHLLVPAILAVVGAGIFIVSLFGGPAGLGGIGLIGGFVCILIGAVWGYLSDWDWRNDLYIIGDQTITIIHKRPLWLQNLKDEILLSQVANVVSITSGFLDSLLNIGHVKLLLVGADANDAKWFHNVQYPQAIQQEISRRQERAKLKKQQDEAERERQAIIEYLSVYHETVTGGAQLPPNGTPGNPDQPPRVRDRIRPPGIPLVRRDNPPGS